MLAMALNEGFKEVKSFYNELKDYSESDFKLVLEHGDFEYLYKFETLEHIQNWQVNSDAGYQIGKSKASLTLTKNKTARFSGYLSNTFDKPEKMKAIYTGYTNMHSVLNYKSFRRKTLLQLSEYSHLILRIRGDGRNYMIVLNNAQYFRETNTYLFAYPLFSHGGPYWQNVKIPFSKFFHVTHGRISDRQLNLSENEINGLGITCMDGVEGPFLLEIDYIGVVKDSEIIEPVAYETYKTEKYISNT